MCKFCLVYFVVIVKNLIAFLENSVSYFKNDEHELIEVDSEWCVFSKCIMINYFKLLPETFQKCVLFLVSKLN